MSSGQSLLSDRITQQIGTSGSSALPGSVHPLARTEFDQGSVDGSLQLHGLSIDFKRSAAQQKALDSLLQQQQDPASPNYRHWLTPATFASQFGVSQSDLSSVSAWLKSQGFTIDKVADSGNSIRFSGTAASAQKAFQTQIHKYIVSGESHFANTSEVVLPSVLASLVSNVGGLHDFKPRPRLVRPAAVRGVANHAQFTSGLSGSHFLAPGDFATIYDVNALYSAGITGAGQTIGIAGQSDIVMADIAAFRSAAGLPANNPTVFLIPGSTDPGLGDASGDINEADLDIEWSGGVAKAANIIFINSTDALTSLQYAIQNQVNGLVIPILSNSYGDCEPNYTSTEIQMMEAAFQQANAQGQTVLGPAGDNGATDCDYTPSTARYPVISATHGLQVDYPASSAYVTAMGGSEFMGDGTAASPATGADQYWNATGSTDLLTSAISYIPEMVWNDEAYDVSIGEGLSGGGGGASTLFAKPSWQTGVPGIPSDGKRDVPDLVLSASADHDAYLVCTQTTTDAHTNIYVSSCNSGFRLSDPGYNDDQSLDAFGGTSVAAPSFAGILALIEQKVGASHGLGNINPKLYTLASNASTYSSVFHDITSGNNNEPCAINSTNCPNGGTIGYSAAAGYDQATGLGSIDAARLAAAFSSAVTQVATTTVVTNTPTTPVIGATVTLTATVTQASGSAAPTGTVTFTIDGTAGTAITLTNNVATATTTFSTGGTHIVTASYSGDTNYFSSTSAVDTITVTSPAAAASTTTTLVAGASTLSLSSSITLTATVQSTTAGTVAGTVTFTNGSATLGSATVTAGANGTGTATLTVSSATAALGFTAGTDTLTATYSGSMLYTASSGTTTVTVTNPGISITIPNMTIASVNAGASGTSTITITSTGGYAGTVNLTATAPSLAATYAFGSTSLAFANNGTASTTITITTVSVASRGRAPALPGREREEAISLAGVSMGALLLFGFRKRRKNWVTLTLCGLVLSSLGAMVGCGGGSSTSAGAAPAGTYAVTVTATDSSNAAITTSTTFNVTIQ